MIVYFSTDQLRATGVGPLVVLAHLVDVAGAAHDFAVDIYAVSEATQINERSVRRALDSLVEWGIVGMSGKGRVRRVSLTMADSAGFAAWFTSAGQVALFYPAFYPLAYDLLRSEFPDLPVDRFDTAVKESLTAAVVCAERPGGGSIVQWVKRALEAAAERWREDERASRRRSREDQQPSFPPDAAMRAMYGDDWRAKFSRES